MPFFFQKKTILNLETEFVAREPQAYHAFRRFFIIAKSNSFRSPILMVCTIFLRPMAKEKVHDHSIARSLALKNVIANHREVEVN